MCAYCSRHDPGQKPERCNRRAISSDSLGSVTESPLRSLTTAHTPTIDRTKTQAVSELLVAAGVCSKGSGQADRIERVFTCYQELRRLQGKRSGGDLQQILIARFKLGSQFQTDQERRSESGSVIRAFSIAVYVEQVLSAQSERSVTRATSRALSFITEVGDAK
jgi:hypothetical protein